MYFSMIFFDNLTFIFVVFFVAVCNMLLFCFTDSPIVWFSNLSITDILVAFVFSSLWSFHPLSFMDCDINANIEDCG